MLFDIAYSLGGAAMVELFDAVIGPVFETACDMATSFGGAWSIIATVLEMILS